MDPGKKIEVDPDPERGLKWIRIRQNAVDPSGAGSATLLMEIVYGLERAMVMTRSSCVYFCKSNLRPHVRW